jgi:hypothetical protein
MPGLEVDQGHREFCASFEASLLVNFRPGLEKGQWTPSDLSLILQIIPMQ